MFFLFCATRKCVKERINVNKRAGREQRSFGRISHEDTHELSVCFKISLLFLPLGACSQEKNNNFSNFFYFRRRDNPQKLSLQVSDIRFQLYPAQHFGSISYLFLSTPPPSLSCPTQKQPMFSLLFQYLLGELG